MSHTLEYGRHGSTPSRGRFTLLCAAIGFLCGTLLWFASLRLEPLAGFVLGAVHPACMVVHYMMAPTPAIRDSLGYREITYITIFVPLAFWALIGILIGIMFSLLPRRRPTAAARLLPRNQ